MRDNEERQREIERERARERERESVFSNRWGWHVKEEREKGILNSRSVEWMERWGGGVMDG